jgi:hypothetical protein
MARWNGGMVENAEGIVEIECHSDLMRHSELSEKQAGKAGGWPIVGRLGSIQHGT